MNRRLFSALIGGLVLLAAFGLATTASAGPPAPGAGTDKAAAPAPVAPAICGGFATVTSFNYPSTSDHINDVAALASNNVWAVGSYNDGVTDRALIEHWTGSAWTVVLDAEPGTPHILNGITALAPDNIWVVGTSQGAGILQYTLVEHWNGTSWTVVSSPNPSADVSVLNAVAGASATDLWAVGYSSPFGNSTHNLLIEHWNGATWSVVPIGTIGTGSTYLGDVAVVNANEVWAVGLYRNGGHDVALALHWNGTVWQVVPTSNPGTLNNEFSSVSVVAANNVWAVGESANNSSPYQPLIERWNGSTWDVVPSIPVGTRDNFLEGVSALGANDIWAAGEYYNGTNYQTLAEHWDGTTWSVVPSANPGTGFNNFLAVVAVGPEDVWAVGDQMVGTPIQTLIEHYTGCPPTVTPTPTITPTPLPTCAVPQNYTYSTTTSNMALGTTDIGNHGDDVMTTLALPFSYLYYNQPYDQINVSSNGNLQFVSSSNAWTNTCPPAPIFDSAILPYWDDLDTSSYPACPGGQCGIFTRTFGTAPNRSLVIEWRAVDHNVTGNYVNVEVLLYEGIQRLDFVYGATSDSGSGATVGLQQDTGSHYLTYTCNVGTLTAGLDIIWNLSDCATPTPVPSATGTATLTATPPPTQTPGGPSATPVASATGTASPTPTTTPPAATATATVCPMQFSDVDATNPFYTYIRCLVCRGIINGYGDSTFRPYNDLTRGQLSKMVTLSAGFNDPIGSTRQTFQDVAPASTFWLYVERLAGRGYISGYPCGGVGEPCQSPTNRPYFRPNNPVTRSQIAKIDANAAGYTDVIPSTRQTFEDVPPGNAFWLFVERVHVYDVVSGYPCGGSGEPCIAPGNRPYYRPYGNAVRGQAAKIVANTFYPGCQTPAQR